MRRRNQRNFCCESNFADLVQLKMPRHRLVAWKYCLQATGFQGRCPLRVSRTRGNCWSGLLWRRIRIVLRLRRMILHVAGTIIIIVLVLQRSSVPPIVIVVSSVVVALWWSCLIPRTLRGVRTCHSAFHHMIEAVVCWDSQVRSDRKPLSTRNLHPRIVGIVLRASGAVHRNMGQFALDFPPGR